MKNHRMMAFTGILVAGSVTLSACASQASTPVAVTDGVLKIENVSAVDDMISVNSSETVKVVPDMAEAVYGVYTEETDAGACQQKNTENVNAVIEYLKGEGFDDKSIETSGYSLEPRYDWSGNERKLVGYEMRTIITLNNIPLDRVGSLLSNVVKSGANGIESVSYFSSKYDEAYQEALSKAVELAKAKAQALAAASGREIEAIVRIQEYGDNQYGRYVDSGLNAMRKEMAVAEETGAMDMAVMPGEMEIQAQINADFSMKPEG